MVCVDDVVRDRPDAPHPVRGAIYTVTTCRVHPVWNNLGVKIAEIQVHEFDWFRADRFRPVVERKTDISIFTAMLNPVPSKVTERVR